MLKAIVIASVLFTSGCVMHRSGGRILYVVPALSACTQVESTKYMSRRPGQSNICGGVTVGGTW